MHNGSWVGLFVPLPVVLLLLGIVAAIVLLGVLFALNQIVGLIISGTVAHVRARRTRTVWVSSRDDETVEASEPAGVE
jgi:hypothetical protein